MIFIGFLMWLIENHESFWKDIYFNNSVDRQNNQQSMEQEVIIKVLNCYKKWVGLEELVWENIVKELLIRLKLEMFERIKQLDLVLKRLWDKHRAQVQVTNEYQYILKQLRNT